MQLTNNMDLLAIDGGDQAVPKNPSRTKIAEESEIVDMWEFSDGRKAQIKDLIFGDRGIAGPHLFRYYNPKDSRVELAEKAMKKLVGAKYCLATNSCTSALVAAYRALGIGAGDEVIVPAYTFFATAATVAACNAIPAIVDIDESLCLDPAPSKA